MKNILMGVVMLCLFTGCTKTIRQSEMEYVKETEIVMYKGKPFTGVVKGEGEYSNEVATFKKGKLVRGVKTYQNGYKEVQNGDGTFEYYNHKGERISKEEYWENT